MAKNTKPFFDEAERATLAKSARSMAEGYTELANALEKENHLNVITACVTILLRQEMFDGELAEIMKSRGVNFGGL